MSPANPVLQTLASTRPDGVLSSGWERVESGSGASRGPGPRRVPARPEEDTAVIPALCPGCRSPIPAGTIKCPWCGRNVNQGDFSDWDGAREGARV